jgi:uracil phosphoribosyltransferase
MLATGGSATLAIHRLLKAGATPDQIHLYGIIAAKPGLEALSRVHPKVTLHLAATDPSLDTSNFIVPGLGDFGDRYFGNL